jgi:hypothetical protein
MKIKQRLAIRKPDSFLVGDYRFCFSLLTDADCMPPAWIDCGEIEIDVVVDKDQAVARVISTLDAEIEKETAEHELKMELLKQRKSEMLALTHEVSE